MLYYYNNEIRSFGVSFLKFTFTVAVMAFCILFANSVAAQIKVVTTLKPLHSIVSNIMLGVGEPILLMRSTVSPHDYKLKPSDARALSKADLIFWIGPTLESRLAKPIKRTKKRTKVVTLLNSSSLKLLKFRSKEGDHAHGVVDPHIWLSTQNAQTIARIAQASLSSSDQKNSDRYAANLKIFENTLHHLKKQIGNSLKSAHQIPFIVYHDAFQYFEKEFGLHNNGAIFLSPEQRPGAKRISMMKKRIQANNIRCVFSEPQYGVKLLKTITSHSPAKIGLLDAIGVKLKPGPGLYAKMMLSLSSSMRACLEQNS